MNGNRVWRSVFIAELCLFAVPLSLLCLVAVGVALFDAVSRPRWDDTIPLALLGSFAMLSVVSGWVLSRRWLRGGAQALANSHWFWWALCMLGALIGFAALVSNFAAPSEQYTRWWYFRGNCRPLAFGLVLLVPLAHLFVERLRYGR